MTSLDSFRCCKTLQVGSKSYAYFSLPIAERNGLKGISRLPFSMKVLLENLLRFEDGKTVTRILTDDQLARQHQAGPAGGHTDLGHRRAQGLGVRVGRAGVDLLLVTELHAVSRGDHREARHHAGQAVARVGDASAVVRRAIGRDRSQRHAGRFFARRGALARLGVEQLDDGLRGPRLRDEVPGVDPHATGPWRIQRKRYGAKGLSDSSQRRPPGTSATSVVGPTTSAIQASSAAVAGRNAPA